MVFMLVHATLPALILISTWHGAGAAPHRRVPAAPHGVNSVCSKDGRCPSLVQLHQGTHRAHSSSAGKRLAFLIPGLKDRLLVHSKAEHVVRHLTQNNVRVDIFIDVLKPGLELGFMWVGGSSVVDSPEVTDLDSITKVFQDAGASVVDVNITTAVEDVMLPAMQPEGWDRFSELKPFNNSDPTGKNEVGRNVIRMFKVLERLMHRAESVARVENQEYDFVLFDRDDSEWMGPLNLDRFANYTLNAPSAVFTRDCLSWNGLNDKTFLFSWPAARAMLSRLFTDMYVPDQRLNTYNSETFWAAWSGAQNVTSVPVPVDYLPTSTSTYVKANGLIQKCQKNMYICPGLQNDRYRVSLCGTDLNHPFTLLESVFRRLKLARVGSALDSYESTLGSQFLPSVLAIIVSVPMYYIPSLQSLAPFVLFFGGQSFLNFYVKAVLSSTSVDEANNLHGIPAPFAITGTQQLVGFLAICTVTGLSRLTPWPYTPKPLQSWSECLTVLMLSLFFCLNIGMNNLSLSILDLSLNIVMRSMTPVLVAFVQLAVSVTTKGLLPRITGVELALYASGCCCLAVTLGVKALASGADSVAEGVGQSMLALGVLICTSACLASVFELLIVKAMGTHLQLNPLDVVFYTALPSTLLLTVPALFLPHPAWPGRGNMTDLQIIQHIMGVNPNALGLVLLSGILALLYNWLLYKIVQGFSAPAAAMASAVNKALTIGIALLMGVEVLPRSHLLAILFVLGIIGVLGSSLQLGLVKAAKNAGG